MFLLKMGKDFTDLNFDDPTPQETARQRGMADRMREQERAESFVVEHDARLLRNAQDVRTDYERVEWLKAVGYHNVYVRGGRKVSLDDALPTYSPNVYRMFKREVKRLSQ